MIRLAALLGLLLSSATYAAESAAEPAAAPPPYTLDDTEVRTLRATRLQRDYQLFIGLPASYRQSDRRYPVLFITDANYGFPLLRSIARRVGNHGQNLDEFILVGLSYAVGDTPEYSRRRDYTPTDPHDDEARSDMPGRAPQFGQAEAYRDFIAKDVFAFIAANYRADMTRKIFAGHSYGSLLGLHTLLTEPAMFQHYILGSPSLWFDHKVMLARERAYASTHRDLPAHVFLAVGASETSDPRDKSQVDMVRDLQGLERALRSRRYPGLRLSSRVIEDEDHLTVAPAILTRGLVWALGTRPARTSAAR